MRPGGMATAGVLRRRALLGAALALPGFGARAQAAWPQRNVRIIVPFAAGGTADAPARIIAEHLARLTGQAWVVENRTGAGGALGIRAVAQATDGHTLLHTTSAIAILPALQRDPGFDPVADLVPVTLTAETPILLAVRGDSRFRDLGDFLGRRGRSRARSASPHRAPAPPSTWPANCCGRGRGWTCCMCPSAVPPPPPRRCWAA